MTPPPLTMMECAVLREQAEELALADSIAESGLGLLLGRLLDEHRALTLALEERRADVSRLFLRASELEAALAETALARDIAARDLAQARTEIARLRAGIP